tara:strand:- start:1284 stop:1853 length:570 start_codon:yes stop_codon:yes gene_type:complete
MKNIIYILIIVFTVQITLAQNWKNDPDHSRLEFSTTHMLISEVKGIFKNFEVKMNAKKPDFSDAVIELTAFINSIDTEVEARDKHLKSLDFFDEENYPVMVFKSNSFKETGKNKYKVTGNLMLHNITKQITVVMIYNGTIVNHNTNKTTAGFQILGEINRLDFNVGAKAPGSVISEDVAIVANLEMQLQ